MQKLKIKKYLSEKTKEIIFSIVDKKQKILLISAMKTGKTTLVMKYINDLFRQAGIQLIFVSPTNSLLNDIQSKYKNVIKCNGLVKSIELNNLMPIISTADSLDKAIETCEKAEKQYLIVYDEIHQVVENTTFREKLRNPFFIYEKGLCVGLLGMTATPEPLELMEFDIKYHADVEEKFIIADKTIVLKNFVNNVDNMSNFIKFIRKKHKDKLFIVRINNKKDIKIIKPNFGNSIAWYRTDNELKEGNEYLKDMEIFEETLTGKDITGIDYIFTSSLGDVGIEYLLKEKPIVIDFITKDSSLVADIQFTGRFRNGIDTLYFVGGFNTNKENLIPKLPNQQEVYEEESQKRQAVINALNNLKTTNNFMEYGIKSSKDEEGIYCFELDPWSLKEYVFKKCIKFYTQSEVRFKSYLANHITFNTKEIKIVDYEKLNIKESKELSKQKKLLKDELKQLEENFFNEIKDIYNLSDDDVLLEIILNSYYHSSELWRVEQYQDLIKDWESDILEEFNKRYKTLKERVPKFKNIKLLEIALSKSGYKKFIEQLSYINYNILFDEDNNLEPLNKSMYITYEIRNYMLQYKKKERDVYLSNKFKLELLEHLKKKKSLSKLTPISLDKHLKLIYNISVNKQKRNIITSIKTNI